MKKVVLAYSGGLDTSCCVSWLQERGYEVICFSANLGSEFSPKELKQRASKSKVKTIYVEDLRREFAKEYILPSLKARAIYENKYILSTALGRPLIAKYLVDIAHKEKASAVAHGCTAKGNDQVRIDTTVKILDPSLEIIAPLREWDLTSRESEIDYAKKKKIPIKTTKEKPYSIDKNIWGVSIEAGVLENLNVMPDDKAFLFTKALDKTPDTAQFIKIEFDKGVPVKLNGKKYEITSLIDKLNIIGGKHCIGRTDLVEDRTVGIKSREIYEAPAAWILYRAHEELESLVLDKETINFKALISLKYAQLVYQGLWFSTLRKSLDSFVQSTQEKVTGEITLKLYKGNIIVSKRNSKFALYKKDLATYGKGDKFNRSWAEGFINIWSMPYQK